MTYGALALGDGVLRVKRIHASNTGIFFPKAMKTKLRDVVDVGVVNLVIVNICDSIL